MCVLNPQQVFDIVVKDLCFLFILIILIFTDLSYFESFFLCFSSTFHHCRRRAKSLEIVSCDPEIERTFRRFRQENQQVFAKIDIMFSRQIEQLVQERVAEENYCLRDYVVPLVQGLPLSIRRLVIQANNFKIKLAIIIMIQTLV